MSDVAKEAGVSKTVVSAVLGGSVGNTRVSVATRQRILDAAKTLKYSPNGIAKALRNRRMNVIGLYIGDWVLRTNDVFFSEIVSGLQNGCEEYHKDLLLHGTFRGQDVEEIYSELINGKVDGLILFVRQDDPLAARMAETSLPVITIADTVPGIPAIVVDEPSGARLIAEFLAARGHQTILYRQNAVLQPSTETRYAAFLEAANALQISVLKTHRPPSSAQFSLTDEEKAYLQASGDQRPTAVVCWNDTTAFGFVKYCHAMGIRVPEDLAIVGFDGIVSETMTLGLTTVRAPWKEAARLAIELVVKRLAGEELPREIVLPIEWVVGETA